MYEQPKEYSLQTAKWISPSLCGCELSITAHFLEGAIINGISYQHPKPFTIEQIDIVKVCDEHKPYAVPHELNEVEFFEPVHWETGESYQARGYIDYSKIQSGAEYLYAHLYTLCGQTLRHTCGCVQYQCVEIVNGRKDVKSITTIQHPVHSKKCYRHHNDDMECTQAKVMMKPYLRVAS